MIQEQIKPHFLYNTLEMIKSMIDLGIYDEAGEAISTLARFYRHSLSKGSNIITIATEIDMVKQYLYIENYATWSILITKSYVKRKRNST